MEENELTDGTRALVDRCAGVVAIRTATDYHVAGELLKHAAAFVKEVKSYFAPLKKQASDMHKSICAKEAAALADAESASQRVRKLMADYQTEQERAARMEKERIEAQNLTPVEAAEKLEAVEAVQERQIQAAVPAPPRVSGVSMRRIADTEKIAAHVKTNGDKDMIPGVYVWCEWKFRVANADLLPQEFTKLSTTVRS